MRDARAALWVVVIAAGVLFTLINGLALADAALTGRYFAAAFFAVATYGSCDLAAIGRRRWRAAQRREWTP